MTVIALPFSRKSHWVLIWCDIKKLQFNVWDSLNYFPNDKSFTTQVEEQISNIICHFSLDELKFTTVWNTRPVWGKQAGGNDCAYFVCAYLRLLAGFPVEQHPQKNNWIREKLKEEFNAGHIIVKKMDGNPVLNKFR